MPGFRQLLSLVVVLALLLVQAVTVETATTKKKPMENAPVSPPMVFAIVRSATVGCEPNCPQWISAEGQIMPGSANQFRKILKQTDKLRLPVVITSPGGDVEAALAIGQMIRERKLDVLVGWTLFTGCNPTAKTCKLPKAQKGVYAGLALTSRGYCLSACPFILASGQKRILGAGAFLGVHEITTQPITQRIRYNETYRIVNGKKKVLSRKVVSRKNIVGKPTTKLSKSFDKKLKAYLNTMGVNLVMLDLLHLAPPSAIHTLSYDEMKSTNLVTAFGDAAELVSNSLCKTTTPADNCKVEKEFVTALAQPPMPPKDFQPGRSTAGPDMTFAIVRSSLAGCEPLCPEWIFASGKITARTPALFKKVLATAGKRRLLIVIRSDGGDAFAAMAMGRLIRARKLDVTVATTLFAGCPRDRTECRSSQDKLGRYRGTFASIKDYCNSACTLILAAGQKRQVELWSTVGVQRLAPDKLSADEKVLKASTAKKPGDDLHSDLGAYLGEMGVSLELLATMDKAPAGGLTNLNFTEMKALKLVTGAPFVARDTTSALCQAATPAENCIKR
ncbi:MAG: hypothetical protein ABI705_00575 [Aestuariivirga sp.]